jgi:hypothetical protein
MKFPTQSLIPSLLPTIITAFPQPQPLTRDDIPAINPYAEHCPVPSTFIISSYSSRTNLANTSDPLNTASFRISYGSANLSSSYGNGNFYCPRKGLPPSYYDLGQGEGYGYDLLCDQDGMVRVYAYGNGLVDLREWHFCEKAPK